MRHEFGEGAANCMSWQASGLFISISLSKISPDARDGLDVTRGSTRKFAEALLAKIVLGDSTALQSWPAIFFKDIHACRSV